MSIEKATLRKLLRLFYADNRQLRSLLLSDIRSERRREAGDGDDGGDFYKAFWADAKDHAAGRSNLVEQTTVRVAANETRKRVYPILTECFLSMLAEKMRWRNEPYQFVPESVTAQLPIGKLAAIVKIENTVAIQIWDGSYRVIYPYFYEKPALPEEGARLGFWALRSALPNFRPEDFRIVDLRRRAYFRPNDLEMRGDEEKQFQQRYKNLWEAWSKLREER